MRTNGAFRWQDAIEAAGGLSETQKRIFGEAREFGASDGVVVPVRLFTGAVYAVSVQGETVSDEPATLPALNLVSQIYCGSAVKLAERRPKLVPDDILTARQAQIIDLLCAGLNQVQAARYLDISERTVEKHLENARMRACVATNYQLIAKRLAPGYGESD
jgi:DNA-binding CsgD family transcriptional regulator